VKPLPQVSHPRAADRALSPEDFLRLVELMPRKGEKTLQPAGIVDPERPDWIPQKWKKGWFAAGLRHVQGTVRVEDAEAALSNLLQRPDGLEEYANWLLVRLAKPRDAWMGFPQHFATQGFFTRVQERHAGAFRKIARGGKDSPVAEERANERFRLLGSIGFSSGVGSEVHVSDKYLFGKYAQSAEAIEWVAQQQKPAGPFQKSARASITKQLIVREFTKIAPDVKSALMWLEEEFSESLEKDVRNESSLKRFQQEIFSLKSELDQTNQQASMAKHEVTRILSEKDRIEDAGSDSARALRDQFDGLRLHLADEIDRLLKVAVEVAKSLDDQQKKKILGDQIAETLALGAELRDPVKAKKRAGG